MDDFISVLNDFFSREIADFGIANISGFHSLSRGFPRTISILMPYKYGPGIKAYDESKFHTILVEIRTQMNDMVNRLSNLLKSNHGGIKHLIVPQGGQDPETLISLFPHKLAAVRSGLGWIGKSSLLITKKHGPRVYLATVLVDCDIEPDKPVFKDECGNCSECLKVCPYHCINDVNWRWSVPREELLDIYLCNEKREEGMESKGRKDECGLCLLACPYGNIK